MVHTQCTRSSILPQKIEKENIIIIKVLLMWSHRAVVTFHAFAEKEKTHLVSQQRRSEAHSSLTQWKSASRC